MTDRSELVKALRRVGIGWTEASADAIEAQARENAALTARAEAAEKEAHDCGAERSAWKARAEAAEAKVMRLVDVSIGATASLAAAVSLLKAGGKGAKKGAASDKMFDQMVRDYEGAIEQSRAVLHEIGGGND